MKIYITYQTPVYGDHKFNIIYYDGPYMQVFDTIDEALEWVRNNDIQITCIDRM